MGLIKAADLHAAVSTAGTGATARVVRVELRDAETEAAGIVARARDEAAQIVADAEARRGEVQTRAYEQGRADGWRDGFAKGSELGRDEALERHDQELRLLVESLGKAIGAVAAAQEEVESAAVADAVELAVAIAERVTKRHGAVDPQVLLENVRAAMKLTARNAASLRIAIHPSQRATLSESLASLRMEWPLLARAEIIEDDTIAPGGCRIRTPQGGVDADLSSQLERIAGKLLPQADAGTGGGL